VVKHFFEQQGQQVRPRVLHLLHTPGTAVRRIRVAEIPHDTLTTAITTLPLLAIGAEQCRPCWDSMWKKSGGDARLMMNSMMRCEAFEYKIIGSSNSVLLSSLVAPQAIVYTTEILRGTIVNRTYGKHKNLYICLFLLTIFGPIYYGPP